MPKRESAKHDILESSLDAIIGKTVDSRVTR